MFGLGIDLKFTLKVDFTLIQSLVLTAYFEFDNGKLESSEKHERFHLYRVLCRSG